jgi:hypothetical protein
MPESAVVCARCNWIIHAPGGNRVRGIFNPSPPVEQLRYSVFDPLIHLERKDRIEPRANVLGDVLELCHRATELLHLR